MNERRQGTDGHERQRIEWWLPSNGLRAVVTDPDGRWSAVVKYWRDEGRLRVIKVELLANFGHPLDVNAWRSFPLKRVEDQANLPHCYAALLKFERWKVTVTNPDETIPVSPAPKSPRKRLPLGNVDHPQARKSDKFYEQVAGLYRAYVEQQRPPAKSIAEDNDVPVSTVHRWVREARRRNLLAPAAAKGRAG